MSMNALVPGMVLGGVIIASLGAGTTYYLEEKQPSTKTVARDFIIGAIMMMMILQLLPESAEFMVSSVLSLVPLSLFTKAQAAEEDTMEVKVGVPNF
jgi:hypothetical protein